MTDMWLALVNLLIGMDELTRKEWMDAFVKLTADGPRLEEVGTQSVGMGSVCGTVGSLSAAWWKC